MVQSMRAVLRVTALALFSLTLNCQQPSQPDPLHHEWHASWVTHPTVPLREPVVLHFRRTLDLPTAPASFLVRVSADNRFILFVNGQRVGDGPARGNLAHWRYERFDLAPFLKPGQNLITATVWNFGVYAPVAQMSDRTAFLLESAATGSDSISTPKGWLVEEEKGHHVLDRSTVTLMTYFASGPGEEIDSSRYDWSWNSPSATDAAWVPVASPMRDSIFAGVSEAHSADTTGDNFWDLVPDSLPPMEIKPTSAGASVRTDLPELKTFPDSPGAVPAGAHVHLLLDRKALTTAYPRLTVSGGKGAHIILTYSEALYDKDKHKGDRDEVGNRTALGLSDSFLPDGGAHRSFEPLWWRTWRYLDLDIQTADEPLQLESLTANFTAYPFEERASFKSGDPDLDKIWEVSWRTARLDAHETYMDTPYFEQLQYIGDTRIQALISYTVGGDDRLGRQAIEAFDQSRSTDGLTRSRFPSSLPQTIPPFSLLWIGMLHDYWLYRPNADLVRKSLAGSRAVLEWFESHEQPDGLLEKLPWWSFIDWVSSGEIPTYDTHSESCATTLEYLGALMDAADLEKNLGDSALGVRDRARAEHVRAGIRNKCWVASRGLVADNADGKIFSQQSNILAVLYDVIPAESRQKVLRQVLAIEPGTTPDGVMSASYYFRFYLARALDHAGMADEYLHSLDPWRELLPMHFSTWPEIPGDTRSDSHAWSAHPIYDMLTLVAGIEPATPGFASVRIAPHLGTLKSVSATFPHPQGPITVEYQRTASGLDATISLPDKLAGTFEFKGKVWPLKPGNNHIQAE
jgi:alpha-L-rhamnosidase